MVYSLSRVAKIGVILVAVVFFAFPVLAQNYTLSVSPESLNFGEVELGKEKILGLNVTVTNSTNDPVDLVVNLTPGLGFCVDKAI